MSHSRASTRGWIAFSLLCVLGATHWLVPDSDAGPDSRTVTLFLGTLLAGGFASAAVLRKRASLPSWQTLIRVGGGGALLLASSELSASWHSSGTSATDWAIALALTPVVIAVAEPALGQVSHDDLPGRLWPGLTAVAGTLLLLPQPSLSSGTRLLILALAPLMSGLGAVLLSGSETPRTIVRATGLSGALLTASLGLMVEAARAQPRPWKVRVFLHTLPEGWPTAWRVGLEGAMLLLSFHILAAWGGFRWAAIFAVAPLLLALEGIVLVRPPTDLRMILGVGLLAIASGFLLLPGGESREMP